jgi:hypothetical protein
MIFSGIVKFHGYKTHLFLKIIYFKIEFIILILMDLMVAQILHKQHNFLEKNLLRITIENLYKS